MEKTMCVLKTLYDMYYEKYNAPMPEMKMHKLMYFAQRESLMRNGRPLFDDPFYGYKHGPVLKTVKHAYAFHLLSESFEEVSDDTRKLLDNVLERYGALSLWKLSSLSHNEFSWKKARKGLKANDNGNVELSLNAMKVDAVRERVYRNTLTA